MSSKSANKKRSWSLALRLTAWYSGATFVLIASVVVSLYWSISAHVSRDINQNLTQELDVITAILNKKESTLSRLKYEVESEAKEETSNKTFSRVFTEKRILAETPGMKEEIPVAAFTVTNSAATDFRIYHSFQLLQSKLAKTQLGDQVTVQIAYNRDNENAFLEDYREALSWILILAFFASSLIGYAIARKGMAPLENMAATTGKITSKTLDQRLEVKHLPKELAALADTFNEMLNRLEDSFQRLSRFSSSIAHELRTPLGNLRGEIEVGLSKSRTAQEYQEILVSCIEECEKLSKIVDGLFFLARAENPNAQIRRETVAVRAEFEKLVDFYEPDALSSGTQIELDIQSDLNFDLDRTLFQRAMSNLMTNSLRYTVAGKIKIQASRLGPDLLIQFEDTGSGIAEEHLPHLFERFYRPDPSRTPSTGNLGLGLSIVKSVIDLHRGSISIDSRVNHGTAIQIRLPMAVS